MLELRVAQKLGKKTGAVNQSVVVKHDAFKKIVKLVYGNMNHIVVRGAISKATIVSFGVPESIVFIAPDTAIKTSPDYSAVKKNGLVGINFTPFINFDWKDVGKIVDKVRSYNKDLVFITNEPLGDIPIIEKFKSDYNVGVLEESSDYLDFAKKIAAYEYLVGARLHANVMALAVKVPVVAIEGLVWKTKELFEQFEYPLPSVNVNDAGWVDSVIDSIEKIEENKIDFNHYFSNVLEKHKALVKNNVSWIKDK
jgi:polysaccharide pyruvyl transferase WcaK-like protein